MDLNNDDMKLSWSTELYPVMKKKRILIVDDLTDLCNVLQRFLSRSGFETVTACNGADGLAKFEKNEFDLVITDLNMPIMNGASMARQIKNKSPEMPLILLTGKNLDSVNRLIEVSGADSVMRKPFRLAEIKEKINCLLNG